MGGVAEIEMPAAEVRERLVEFVGEVARRLSHVRQRGSRMRRRFQYVTAIAGDEPNPQVSLTRGWRGEQSSTRSTRYRSLLPPNALRQMRSGEALLIYGQLPPVKLTLRPWFRDGALARLGSGSDTTAPS